VIWTRVCVAISVWIVSAITLSAAVDSVAVLQDLRLRLDKLYGASAYRNSRISAKVVSLKNGAVLYERNADLPLTPASTTKLFSTATLYSLRGPNASLITDVRTDGVVDASGILRGNIYLVGCGDALLSSSDIDLLADEIERLGIKKITGAVFGDGTAFDGVVNRARYSGDNEDVEPLPPITALSLQRGTIAVVVSASKSGVMSVQAIPESDAIDISEGVTVSAYRSRKGHVRAGTPSSRKALARKATGKAKPTTTSKAKAKAKSKAQNEAQGKVKRAKASLMQQEADNWQDRVGDAPREKRKGRARRVQRSIARVHASSSMQADGVQRVHVTGRITPGTSTTLYVSMTKPALVTAGVLRQRLRSRGVVIQGQLDEKQAPAASKSIASVKRPLIELASIVNKKSDNYLAEHVFKMCGAAAGTKPSNAETSVQCVTKMLDSLRIPRNGCMLNDGSGLSRRNLASATTQVALLQRIASSPWAAEYTSTLAIAGTDGTIRKRMVGTFAANNVKAKTGTLRNASALSGYVTTRDGELLAFSFISNGNNVSSYKSIEDQASLIISSFSWTVPQSVEPTK